jgi:putative membrane protein
MILPGISGAFILVLLGKYLFILEIVNNIREAIKNIVKGLIGSGLIYEQTHLQQDVVALLIVTAGATVGIVTFAQILGWFFRRYHDITVAVLIGFMLGSLRKIWPWKDTLDYIVDHHGEKIPIEQINVLPPAWDGQFIFALLLAIIGFAAVFILDYVASRQEVASSQQGVQN